MRLALAGGDLPSLRWFGPTRARRVPAYGPDPNGWLRITNAMAGGTFETTVYVPRRYQWWVRLVRGYAMQRLVVAITE